MKKQTLIWLIFGAFVGATLGLSFGKGDPWAPVFMAVIGTVLGFCGGALARLFHGLSGTDIFKTNTAALLGTPVGAVAGGILGASSPRFGRRMIALFNPDLPEQDFVTFFGATGGLLLGAFAGACLAGGLAFLWHKLRARP